MKITIRSQIKIDKHEEIIKETYDGELKRIAGKTVLIYKNEAEEKVLLKFDEQELTMTRFTDKPVTMRFHEEFRSEMTYEGLGNLSVLTEKLSVNIQEKLVKINYQLAQNDLKIGDYRLHITWLDEEEQAKKGVK
ncbi:DUF1934 domain-containing protein [Lactococcus protaetiae]|uniref:DUF1934 domain-containing protein n=1 Tax=Lactococcus protaetiae TaxID=2592653 RepID=A0A514Z9D1_9LACT|nr:DUF1934 domain-containing protein [Lactococcus protaetiae]MCL2113450.1 DUF1934 domain-containing protein [Streptococcaceae bacterium]QDK71183.1 DUF1934 domain-containing protein [Lactococcus protaetiae]